MPRGARSAMSRHGLLRVYKHALVRLVDPAASLPYTPRRVLTALRAGGAQAAEEIRSRLRGRTPRLSTVLDALDALQAAELAVQDQPRCWRPCAPPDRSDLLAELRVRGPHDLRHTFATWLEDAGIPARVIDELMGHAGGRHGEHGSPVGRTYRHTSAEMRERVVSAIEERLAAVVRAAEIGGQRGLGRADR
jgi:hypothetical protein